MKCQLCEQTIANYNPAFHNMKINESHTVDICSECMDKIVKWQGEVYSKLYPTKIMKKRFGKE